MDLANYNVKTVINMKENGRMIKFAERGILLEQMEIYTKEIG